MIRHTMVAAVIAVAALTLGACGSSTSGTPTAQETSSVESSASDTTAAADVTSATATEEESTAADTATVGDGTLDPQTAQWFTAACTGLQPLGDMLATVLGVSMAAAMATGEPAAGSPSPQDLQKQLADSLTSAGTAMTDAQSQLASTPPPAFDKGEEMAQVFGSYLTTMGAKLSEVGESVASAPVTDAESLQAALAQIESLGSDVNTEEADLLGQYDLDPATQAAIEELPACKAMQDAMGGFLGSETTTEG